MDRIEQPLFTMFCSIPSHSIALHSIALQLLLHDPKHRE